MIDDATSRLMVLRLVKSESTENYLEALDIYLNRYGCPISFYVDKSAVFRVNRTGDAYKGTGQTQVGRAFEELGIELICANSPQAKGGVERSFQTHQDRLIKELRERGISNFEEANEFLETYMKEHNERFAVPAENKTDAPS